MEAGERSAASPVESHAQTPALPSKVTDSSSLDSIYTSIQQYPFDTDTEFQAGLSSILGHPETPATQAEKEQKAALILKAQCFYYARKFNTKPVDPVAYKAWTTQSTTTTIPSRPQNEPSLSLSSTTSQAQAAINPTSTTNPTSVSATASQPPPYPTSFAAIVELITSNKPIPGIEEIPDTVLTPGSSKQDKATRRRKPWEKENNAEITTTPAPAPAPAPSPGIPDTQQDKNGGGSTNPETQGDTSTPASAQHSQDPRIDGTEYIRKTGVGVMHILSPDAVADSGLIAKE